MTKSVWRHRACHFEAIPFDLKNFGASFYGTMDNLSANEISINCYFNGVVVHSAAMEEPFKHLEKIMLLLRKYGLHFRVSKCFFVQLRVHLHGHAIDRYVVQALNMVLEPDLMSIVEHLTTEMTKADS